jgi:hypothetical protein
MLRFFPALALVLVTAAPTFSETQLSTAASLVWAQPVALPAETTLLALEPGTDDEKFAYTIRRQFSQGTFTEEWTSNHATTLFTFRADGRLISKHHENRFRHTTIDVTVNEARTSVHTVFTENGKVTSDHTAALNPAVIVSDELNHLVVQAWRAGIRDRLAAQSLEPNGDHVGDSTVVFRQVSDPTSVSRAYRYPAEFQAAFGGGPYVVADMSLTGIASLFFPHHIYFVYVDHGGTLEWVAYFGGDPNKPVFEFTPKRG